jgi:predicted RNA-binding protein (virulence factor B family)
MVRMTADEALLESVLGRTVDLPIARIEPPGAYMALRPGDPKSPAILLPGSELDAKSKRGDVLSVFVHRDSQGRPLATRKSPRVRLGEVAFLEVTARSEIGVFVDWGLPKELLVPFAEETTEMRVGQRYAVGLYVDSSKRLAGTMRVAEMLSAKPRYEVDAWVDGEAWRDVPEIGLFVIVEKKHVGLVPRDEPHSLKPGDAARFRVSHVHLDRKIELSLRGHVHEEIERDANAIFAALESGGAPISERASPEEIRARFGLSKKAFKRAVGRLMKDGRVELVDGTLRMTR